MDATDDWRSLLNFKYAEPEYQALFSGDKRSQFPPPPPPYSSGGSVKKSTVDGGSVRSEIFRVEDVLDGRPLYEQFPAIRFPALPHPEIPEPLDTSKYGFDLEGIVSRIDVQPEDNEILASIKFLQAVLGNLVNKAAELRQSIIDHAAYIRQLQQPTPIEDTDYIEATIFPNYVSMKDELQEIADELALLKPWKVRHLFLDELDEDSLIETAGGINNHSAIIHLLAQSYGVGHKYMELENAIVSAGQALQDETTRSVIAVSQLHDYTAAMVRYPPGPYPKAIGVHVRWDGLKDMYEKVVSRRSALSQDFERFMLNKRLPVTNALFAYLQHPAEYAHFLVLTNYRFAPGEFAGMLDWLEQQDEQALRACRPLSSSSSSATTTTNNTNTVTDMASATTAMFGMSESKTSHEVPVAALLTFSDPSDSVLRRMQALVIQDCQLSDREAHRLAQTLPRLTRLAILNLSHNNLSSNALASFATIVFQFPQCIQNLQLLYLSYNRIRADGVTMLTQILHPLYCTKLLLLALDGNPIGDAGAHKLFQCLLNPQRRASQQYPALHDKRHPKKHHKHHHKSKHNRRGRVGHDDDDHDEDEEEEEEEEEEVLMTLDHPLMRGSNLLSPQLQQLQMQQQQLHMQQQRQSGRIRSSILYNDNLTQQIPNNVNGKIVSAANNRNNSGMNNNNENNAGPLDEVQLAVQSQRRYPLHCYLSDYFAPTLVLETLRSLLAAAEYDVQHGGDGKATLRQHHYNFQQQQNGNVNTDDDNDDNRGNKKKRSSGKVRTMDYAWVNDIDVDEFNMDLPSDYSNEASDVEDERLRTAALRRVQKLRGVSVTQSSAGYRAVPERTIERIEMRIQRSRDRKRRLKRLTYRERLILREKRALGVHKTRRALREQRQAQRKDSLNGEDADEEEAEEEEEEDLLEESSADEDADYHESDEEEVVDQSGFNGGFDLQSLASGEYRSTVNGEEDDDDNATQVLSYANNSSSTSHVNARRASNVTAHTNTKSRRSSVASQMTTTTAGRRLLQSTRPVLTCTSLLQRAKQNQVFGKYPRLAQTVLRLRLKLIAVSMFQAVRRRTLLPYFASLSLARCQLTAAILPALVVVLRENNCLVSLDLSHNEHLLARQEDCSLLASGLRYSLDMKKTAPAASSQHNSQYKLQNSTNNFSSNSLLGESLATSQRPQTHSQLQSQQQQAAPIYYATSLQQLSLNHVGLTDAGLVALAPALNMPSCPLVRIELRGNGFGPTAANVLANLCQRAHYYLGSAALVRGTRQTAEEMAVAHTSGNKHKNATSSSSAAVAAVGWKVKPPVFSAEDDDFHRDEGFLADDQLLDAQAPKKLTLKDTKNSNNNGLNKDSKSTRRMRRESLALGGQQEDWNRPIRLVDDDEDSLNSFQDGDTWTDDGEEGEEDYEDEEDDD